MLNRQQELEIIRHVREVAAIEIVPRFRCLPSSDVSSKSSYDDLVTIADLGSERELTKRFQTLLPNANVLGEEAVAENPALLDSIENAELTVIIDPIDGTWNFANGLATFGVLIAVMHHGKTVFGLLYDPVLDDWIEASLGRGCWYQKADQPPSQIRLSSEVTDPSLTGFISPFQFNGSQREKVAIQQMQYGRSLTIRCCCHEYRSLAQGSADFYVSPKPNVWDHAAGILAYQEAGGVVTMLGGSEYHPTLRKGVILAARSQSVLDIIANDFSVILATE